MFGAAGAVSQQLVTCQSSCRAGRRGRGRRQSDAPEIAAQLPVSQRQKWGRREQKGNLGNIRFSAHLQAAAARPYLCSRRYPRPSCLPFLARWTHSVRQQHHSCPKTHVLKFANVTGSDARVVLVSESQLIQHLLAALAVPLTFSWPAHRKWANFNTMNACEDH